MRKIAIGADHAGFELKQHLIKYLLGKGNQVADHGTDSTESVYLRSPWQIRSLERIAIHQTAHNLLGDVD